MCLDVGDVASAQFLGYCDALHLLVDEPLEGSELLHFTSVVAVHQGEALAVVVGACGASDAVHVVLRVVRHVVVDDQGNAAYVDAARDDVGGDDDVGATCSEGVHHLLAVLLLQVGVHCSHLEAFLAQGEQHVTYVSLATHEDHDTLLGILEQFILDEAVLAASVELLQEADQHRCLLRLMADAALLVYLFGGLRDGDLDHHGVPHDILGQSLRLGRHRGTIEDLLTVIGQELGNGHDVVIEAHVEHAVCLVEYEEGHLRKIHISEVDVRKESARRGYHYISALAQSAFLGRKVCALTASIDGYRRGIDEV